MYDVIVIGAGTGGSVAALTCAQLGLYTLLIDQKTFAAIGDKACGDGVNERVLQMAGLPVPHADEVCCNVRGVRIWAPNLKSALTLRGHQMISVTIDRYRHGQGLLTKAEGAGAEILTSTQVLSILIEQDSARGVVVKDAEGKITELRGRVVIDAGGFSASYRQGALEALGILTPAHPRDVAVCYRELRQLRTAYDPESYCHAYLSQEVAPGGIFYVFPKHDTVVNVGLGLPSDSGGLSPRKQLYRYVFQDGPFAEKFDGSHLISSLGALLPMRRPLDYLVGNGLMLVGDAACQANPLTGGGIESSMLAAQMAGQQAFEAIRSGLVTQWALWSYPLRYLRENDSYGSTLASLEIFRLTTQTLNDQEIDFIVSHHLIAETDILAALSLGQLNFSTQLRKLLPGLRMSRILKLLLEAGIRMKALREAYLNYPSTPDEHVFRRWRARVREVLGPWDRA